MIAEALVIWLPLSRSSSCTSPPTGLVGLAARGLQAPRGTTRDFSGEEVVQTFEAESVRGPEREVVEPDEPVDAKTGAAVVPRGVADEFAEKPAARVLDTEDACAVERGAERQWTLPNPVMYGLEERLRKAVDGHVQEAARAAPPRVNADEERVNRPAGEAVDEKARSGSGATHSRDEGCEWHHPGVVLPDEVGVHRPVFRPSGREVVDDVAVVG
jgi:hypothetical protein